MKKWMPFITVGLILLLFGASGVLAAPLPSSVSAANYYDMTPNPWYVSLGVKGFQQTTAYTCGPLPLCL